MTKSIRFYYDFSSPYTYIAHKKIREIQNIYRLLYQKNYNNSQACAIIEAEMEASDERDEILMFIKNSHRGIMKGYTKSN